MEGSRSSSRTASKRKNYLEEDEEEEDQQELLGEEDMDDDGVHAVKGTKGGRGRPKKARTTTKGGKDHEYYSRKADKDVQEMLAQMDNAETDEEDEEEIPKSRKNPSLGNLNAGAIMRIYVENFMCHRKFKLSLGAGLNFITGRNGSGKSAIAAAIQLCLGANTRATGRGANLHGLIREGSSGPAILQVTLYNEGPDAYYPEKYGTRIMVERRIPKSGAASYHIKGNPTGSEKFEEISREKSELQNIMRCFDIYVDNPCCVLTQEESKKFIQGNETDKYEFFLKATGLQNLKEELMEMTKTLDETNILRENHEKNIDKKRVAVKELEALWEKIKALEGKEKEIQMCDIKALWYDYNVAQGVYDELEKAVNKKQKAASDAKEKFENASRSQRDGEDEIAVLNNELARIQTEQADIEKESKQKNADVAAATKAVNAKKATITHLQRTQEDYRERLNAVTRQIRELREKALQKAEAGEREIIEKLTSIDQQLKSVRSKDDEVRREKNEAQQKEQRLMTDSNRFKSMIESGERSIVNTRNEIQSLRNSGNQDKVAFIHPRFPALLQAMRRVAFTGPVVGPVAMHVKIAENFDQWSAAVERAIGGQLSSFVVTNGADRAVLDRLMRENGVNNVPIIMQANSPRYAVQNVSQHARSPSVLDAVNITDDLVFNCLVDQVGIERILLANNEQDVLKLFVERDPQSGLDRLKFGASAVVTAQTLSMVKYSFGNQSSELGRRTQNLLAKDVSVIIANRQQELEEQERELQGYRLNRERCEEELRQSKQMQRSSFDSRLQELAGQTRMLQREKSKLQEELTEIQEAGRIDTSGLEQEENELQQAIEQIKTQSEEGKRELALLQQELKHKQGVKAEVDQRVRAIEQQLSDQAAKIDDIVTDRANAMKSLERLRKERDEKEKDFKLELEKQENQFHQLEKALEAASQATKTFDPEWDESEPWHLERKETRSYLERKKKELEAELKASKRQADLGNTSPRIIRERLEKAREELEAQEAQARNLNSLVEQLTSDAQERKKRWMKVLKKSAKKVKDMFDQYVQEKGSSGSVVFDHNEHKLQLQYQVDNTDERTAANDVRNLSGGERSYVTFSLQLALGHVIESPFRLLDEYDVFLDNIARKLTLDQLQKYAKKHDQASRQFIVITPHSLNDVGTNDLVRIHRMTDPERNSATGLQQQTL